MEYAETLTTKAESVRATPCLLMRTACWLAWSLWVVAVSQAAFGLLLAVLNRLSLERLFAEYVVDTVAAALAFATVGAIIATRRPGNAVGWLCCTAGVGSGMVAWTSQYARYALVTRPDALPGGAVAVWLDSWVWLPPAALATVFLPLLFPHGRLPSTRWRPLVWLAASAIVMLTASIALGPAPVRDGLPKVSNPFALEDARLLLDVMNGLGILLMLASLAGAVAAQVVRFRRARGEERQQLKWVAYATALLVGAIITPSLVNPSSAAEDTLLSGILLSVAYPGLPVAVGVAVLRYRLYDIDLIINRTLVYGALTGCIVGVYVFVVGYLGVIFQAGGNLLISLVATGLVAVLFAPLRDWLQRGVNRLMYGERDEPYRVISRLGERLEAALAPDAVLPAIVGTVRDALRLSYAAIALPADGGFEIAAASGKSPPNLLRMPLSYQGQIVGQLLMGPRGPGEGFSPADRHLLDDLAHHAGVAVHGVKVMTDLQRSREQLVLAREEERRRLRRDLHDELAPTLAALGLTAATVGELIPRDPDRATAVNAKLEAALRAAVGDIRRLVYDLRPPALDELGLVEAIRERADQYSSGLASDLTVKVEVSSSLPPLPAGVEVAVYRIVQEALNNVARHARAHNCVVRLHSTEDGWLRVDVVDDGIGLRADHKIGVGLPSMEERAAELGGNCSLEHLHPPACASRSASRYREGVEMESRSMDTLRVLLADDHPFFRDGMRMFLETTPDIAVVGEAATGEEAVGQAKMLSPDVVLMDIKMPGLSGIEATRRILEANPGVRVLVVTMFEDDATVFTAMRAGARGYILKDAGKDDVLRATRAVGHGEAIFSSGIASRLIDFFTTSRPAAPREAFPTLTAREREMLHLMTRGASNAEIARLLSLSTKTVANYVSNILSKLQATDREEAVLRAREAGLGQNGP